MKLGSIAATVLLMFTIGCGGGQADSSSPPNPAQGFTGAWTAQMTSTVGVANLQMTLVSSPCSVSTPLGTFSITSANNCYLADDNTGQGSISGSGAFALTPQGLLMGVANPPTPGAALPVAVWFVEADQYGDAEVFVGQGSFQSGEATGWFGGPYQQPGCTSQADQTACQYVGSFTATKK